MDAAPRLLLFHTMLVIDWVESRNVWLFGVVVFLNAAIRDFVQIQFRVVKVPIPVRLRERATVKWSFKKKIVMMGCMHFWNGNLCTLALCFVWPWTTEPSLSFSSTVERYR
jgi:hypothetical protein